MTDVHAAADRIILEAAERLEAAGVPSDEIPHAVLASGLAMLEADMCPACLAQVLMDVRKEVSAKILQAQRSSGGRHVH